MYQQTYRFGNFIVTFSSLYNSICLPFQSRTDDAGFDLRIRVEDGLSPVQLHQDLIEVTLSYQEFFFLNGTPYPYSRTDLQTLIERENSRKWLKIPAGATKIVPTGVKWQVVRIDPKQTETTLALFIYPRSGLAAKSNLCLANAVGVVDMGYPDEICLALQNRSSYDHYLSEYSRAAQGVLQSVYNLGTGLVVRESGFGHTGV